MRKLPVLFMAVLLCAAGIQAAGAQQHRRLMDQAVQLAGQGRYAEAVEAAGTALKRAEEALGPDHLDVALALNNLAEFHQMAAFTSKDRAAALAQAAVVTEPLHHRALEIREKALGVRNSFTLASMINLARTYSLEQRYDEAEAGFRRAQAVIREMASPAPILADLDRQATMGLNRIAQIRSEKR